VQAEAMLPLDNSDMNEKSQLNPAVNAVRRALSQFGDG